MKKNHVITLIAVLLIGIYLYTNQPGRGAFTGTNALPNADVENWNTAGNLPIGWTATGYSSPSLGLARSTTPLHLGAYSATFPNKGYITGSVTACPNWCVYETDKAPVTAGQTLNARFFFYPSSFTRGIGTVQTDGVRTFVKYYDAAGVALASTNNIAGPILKETQFSNPAWQEYVFTGTVPATAATAVLRFEFGNVAGTNEFAATFTLDDMWIESGTGGTCTSLWTDTSGNPNCGAWSACSGGTQTRTCTDRNACLIPNPPNPYPTSQTCTGGGGGANALPNPGVESWNVAVSLPLGWTTTGYSSPVYTLTRTITPIHEGTYGVTFPNKGYITGSVTACPNWCIYETDKAPVTAGTAVNAYFWFYPTSFTRGSGTIQTDGVRTWVKFYDSVGVGLPTPNSLVGPILKEAQFATPSWQKIPFTGTVPATAASAVFRIEFGNIAGSNEFAATFTLDDMWIESAYIPPSCTSAWRCGAWSTCSAGTQTRSCTDDNNCNPPNPPNPNPTSQTCTTTYTIQDRVAQYKAGSRTMQQLLTDIAAYRAATPSSGPPDTALVTLFDAQTAAYPYTGTGYNRFAMAGGYGWQGANALDSLLTMYDATRDTKYLAKAKTGIDAQIAGGIGAYSTDSAQHGNIAAQYTRFAYYVRRDGLTQYGAAANDYYAFAVNNFLNRWSAGFKSFTKDNQDMGCFTNYDNNWACDRWNAASGMALSFLYAYLYESSPNYLDKAIRHATFFKTQGLHVLTGCSGTGSRYSWGYRAGNTGQPGDIMPTGTTSADCTGLGWGRYECNDREEDHYALYELRMVYAFWEKGFVFTDADMAVFAQTFKDQLNGNTANPNRQDKIQCWTENPDAARHNAFETGYLQGFAKYAHFDSALESNYRTIITKLTTSRDSGGHSQYYQCVTKANGQAVCWDGGTCSTLPATYSCRVAEREMIVQSIADLAYSSTHP